MPGTARPRRTAVPGPETLGECSDRPPRPQACPWLPVVSRVSSGVAIRASLSAPGRFPRGSLKGRSASRPAQQLPLTSATARASRQAAVPAPSPPPALTGQPAPPGAGSARAGSKALEGVRLPRLFRCERRAVTGTPAPAPAGKHARQPRPPGGGSRRGPAPAALPLPAGAVCVRVVLAVPSAADTACARSRPRRDTRFCERGGGGVCPRRAGSGSARWGWGEAAGTGSPLVSSPPVSGGGGGQGKGARGGLGCGPRQRGGRAPRQDDAGEEEEEVLGGGGGGGRHRPQEM